MKLILILCALFLGVFTFVFGQCEGCGNGIQDTGETILNCPSDFPHPATCSISGPIPSGSGSAPGIRISEDFSTTSTTLSASGLPTGWTLSAIANDAYGAKQGLITPNGSTGNRICTIPFNLGGDFDGRPNVTSNTSFAILRGTNNPFISSPTYNMSGVEGFKIQFWLAGSTSSCGGSFSGCSSATSYLEFSSNGGTTWTQIMEMKPGTSADMCSSTTNSVWFKDGSWSRVCLTVFKSTSSEGNYYPAASATSAGTGMMVNSAFFTANFKYRIRYSGSSTCSTISATNPGPYLAIDYPVITSGNQMIPCGLSFLNACGYGFDNNDDGVGSSTSTQLTTVFGTTKRGMSNAERGVELLNSQNASFQVVNTGGSNFATDYVFGNPEGGDRQCVNWQTGSNNSLTAVYEVVADFKPSSGGLQMKYFKDLAPKTLSMTHVTASGKTPSIGWRYAGTLYVSCGSTTADLNPGCNGYMFVTTSLPNNFARAFYNLDISNLGAARSIYGATSCSNYFNGPYLAPIAAPVDIEADNDFVECSESGLVFKASVDYCSPSTFTGTPTYILSGPNGFQEEIDANTASSVITTAGEYTIVAQTPDTPKQCLDCGKKVCVTVSQAQIDACVVPLSENFLNFSGKHVNQAVVLEWEATTDMNSSHFSIERSEDGIYFTEIGKVAIEKYTHAKQAFTFEDTRPLNKAYYRLKFHSFDGEMLFERVILLDLKSDDITIYPNPSTGYFTISGLQKSSTISILDASGRIIQTMETTVSSLPVELHAKAGIYFVEITTNGRKEIKKVVLD